jgi:hypothetical protein
LQPDLATRALLEDLAEQVRRLEKLGLGELSGPAVGPVAFGFRAFFGFVLGMGVLAVVAIVLLAAVGFLFHPPALELLRQVFHTLTG